MGRLGEARCWGLWPSPVRKRQLLRAGRKFCQVAAKPSTAPGQDSGHPTAGLGPEQAWGHTVTGRAQN